MMSPDADQEREITSLTVLLCSPFLRENTARDAGPRGDAPGALSRQGERNCESAFLLWFLQEGMGKTGQEGLDLTSGNNFCRLWDTGCPWLPSSWPWEN